LALLGVLALAACTSGDAQGGVTAPPSAPATSETLTAEPTTEPSDTGEAVAPPEMPAEAREQTAEGAAAFATHFFAVADHAFAVGEPAHIGELSGDECSACKYMVDQIDDWTGDGATFQNVSTEVTSAAAPPPDGRGVTVASLLINESESRVVGAGGEILDVTPATHNTAANVFLQASEQGWLVLEIAGAE